MQEYREIVDEITRELGVRHREYWKDESCNVHIDTLRRVVEHAVDGRGVLCYPGGSVKESHSNLAIVEDGYENYHPEVFFFAFLNELYRTHSTYHSLEWALQQMVSHLKEYGEATEAAILVADIWNPNHFARFIPELKPFAEKCKIELYFFDGPGLHFIHFP